MKDNELKAIKIHGFKKDYYSIPNAAKVLGIPASTLRNYASAGWLNGHDIPTEPEDLIESITHRKYFSKNLVERMKPRIFSPVE